MRSHKSILAVLVVLAAWAVPVLATGGNVDPIPFQTASPGGQVMIDTVPLPESPASSVMIGTWPTPERVLINFGFILVF
jgi:hypothetical protein